MADNPYSVNVVNPLQALLIGQQAYTTGQEANRKAATEQARQEATQLAQGGDYKSAIGKLLGAGDMQGVNALAGIDNNQWQRQHTTQQDAESARRFGMTYGLQKRAADRADDPTPANWVRDPNAEGGFKPIGSAMPSYQGQVAAERAKAEAQFTKPRQLSLTDISKLSEEGGKLASVSGFVDTFQPEYAGYKIKAIGEAANLAGRNLPESVVGKTRADGANWWQGYDRYKNVIRNDLYGSALTASEIKSFEAADITPGMDPAQVSKNLKIQKTIIENGIKRKVNAATSAGYDPGTISKAYGIDHGISAPKNMNAPDSAFPPPPKIGEVRGGYRYKGGNPGEPSNWAQVQ